MQDGSLCRHMGLKLEPAFQETLHRSLGQTRRGQTHQGPPLGRPICANYGMLIWFA